MCLFIHLFMHSDPCFNTWSSYKKNICCQPLFPNHRSAQLSKSQLPGKKHKMTTINNSTSNINQLPLMKHLLALCTAQGILETSLERLGTYPE